MAARYRKIDPRIWNDAKFCALSDRAKLVFFMILTHPSMTALGAMRGSLAGLAEEIRWRPEEYREAFREVFAKGMLEHDPEACLIALPKFLKYNPPESPNVVIAWSAAADLLPECVLKTLVIQRAKGYAEALPEAFGKAFAKAFGKTSSKSIGNQEQEQEQEQEKRQKTPPTPPLGGDPGQNGVGSGDVQPAKGKRRPKAAPNSYDPASIDLPFASERFVEIWASWIRHRKDLKKPLTPESVKRQLPDLIAWGEERAIAAIDYSIKKGYTGIFEEWKEMNGQQFKTKREKDEEYMKKQVDSLFE